MAGQLDDVIQSLQNEAMSTCLRGMAMEHYNKFTKKATKSVLMAHMCVVNLHIKVKKWRETGDVKVALDLLVKQRCNIKAIMDALAAFKIEKKKANANTMEESLAALFAHGIIAPLSFHALFFKDRERQGKAGE